MAPGRPAASLLPDAQARGGVGMEIELKLGGVGVEVEIDGVRGLLTALGIAAVAAAVAQELRAPPAERDWRGRLVGAVPYDLRPPTWQRLRGAMWAPASPER